MVTGNIKGPLEIVFLVVCALTVLATPDARAMAFFFSGYVQCNTIYLRLMCMILWHENWDARTVLHFFWETWPCLTWRNCFSADIAGGHRFATNLINYIDRQQWVNGTFCCCWWWWWSCCFCWWCCFSSLCQCGNCNDFMAILNFTGNTGRMGYREILRTYERCFDITIRWQRHTY